MTTAVIVMHIKEFVIKQIDTKKIIFILLTLYAGLIGWFSYNVYSLNQILIYAEHGILENTQAFTLLIACIVFFLPTVSQQRPDKIILSFFSFLCLNFFLREVDLRDLDVPAILQLIAAGNGRKIMITIGFVIIFAYAFLHRARYKDEVIKFIFSNKFVLMGIAAVFLFMSGFFEEANSVLHHVFLEELVELFGYILILIVAIMSSKNSVK